MGNGAEQLAAFGQVATDAFAHGIERAGHLDHLAASAFGHRFHLGAQRHMPRGTCQALERTTLQMHQQADEQQQEGRGQQDEPQLLGRQYGFLQAGVGLRQQRGDVQPLPWCQLDLRHQHRRIDRLQGQCVMRPGAWQFVELQAAVEDAQIIRADESHRNVGGIAQRLAQHLGHRFGHHLLARRGRQQLHLQRSVIEADHEARTSHAAQLVEHKRPVIHRQRTEVTHAGRHRMCQAARRSDQPFELGGAQLRQPDGTGQRLRREYRQQGEQQHTPEQRARQPAPRVNAHRLPAG